MLRHVVLLKWNEDATAEQIESVVSGMRALPAAIPQIRSYEVGRDLGLRDGAYDLGLVAEFDDADAWRTYLAHPDHVEVVANRITPIMADRASVQFDLG